LHPLPIPQAPWKSNLIDFITDLPSSQENDDILVVVDRFSKMAHFIPCSSSITSEATSTLFLREIFRLHGLPDNIISDCGPQFIAGFWKRLLELLHIDRSLSSAHHPESNGQIETTNQTLEQYLHCFISYQQDDCVDWLAIAEFAYNNSIHSTKQTPFFIVLGQHPRWSFIPDVTTSYNPQAEHRLQQLQQVHSQVMEQLQRAQNNSQHFANRHEHRTPNFQVGDQVWLLQKDIPTKRPFAG
jgi:transposase InsO family protein